MPLSPYPRRLALLLLLIPTLAGTAAAASEQPRYDTLQTTLVADIQPAANRMEAIADVRIRILDRTNYIAFRLNGNLVVTHVEDDSGEPLRFIQDDTDKFEVMINLIRPREAGTEMTIHLEYNGLFSRLDFDFFKQLGNPLYAYISPDMVELPAASMWFPRNTDPMDRSAYELQVTLPTGLRPFTAGLSAEIVDTGLAKTYIFKSAQDILAPTLVAGRYQVQDYTFDGLTLQTWFLTEFPEQAGSAQRYAEIVKHLRHRWNWKPAQEPLRIVEVSDNFQAQFGMLDSVFLTTREFTSKNPENRQIIRKFAYQKWLLPLRVAAPEDIWILEGLSQYAAALFFEDVKGAEAFDATMRLLAVDALKYQDAEPIARGVHLGVGSEKYDSVVVAKSAWVFHMLRTLVGREKFETLLATVWQRGSLEPLSTRLVAEITRQVTGADYTWFFNQWINTIDLPEFTVEYIVYRLAKGGFQTVGKVNQTLTAFQIPLELMFVTKGQDELKVIEVKGESTRLNIETETRPTQLVVDPNFRILRKSEELEIQVHIVRGDEHFELGDFPSATDEYKRVLERQPRNSLALFKLALIFYEQFNYNTAQNTFREALNGDQQPPWVVALCYMYMGKVFDVLGQRQRAVAEYNKAVNTNDDSRGAVTEATKYLSQPFTRAKTYLPGQPDAASPEPKQPEEDKTDADAPAKDPGR